MRAPAPSPRARVRRLHELARYDRDTVFAILDAMPLAHLAYVIDGAPYCTPTLQWREGERLYWHGSSASRFLEAAEDAEVCLTVTLWDGVVIARSGFHHSANYRSAMVLGRARKVTDPDEKTARLEGMFARWFPGRWDMLRPMSGQELKATTVLGMELGEASVKIRTGPPKDDEEDYALPIWAGVVPLRMETLAPVDDPRNLPGLTVPDNVAGFRVG